MLLTLRVIAAKARSLFDEIQQNESWKRYSHC
jgi:hypothetical protein